jgi:predicted TIM-barrel fold metal-dependent hydrolase
MKKRIFFDSHCHFFNLDDIAIFPTIMGLIPINTFLLLGLSIRQLAVKQLMQFKPFIQFFERSRKGNLEKYSKDIWRCASKNSYDEVILTPLVMDFSTLEDSVENVSDQLSELLAAIRLAEANLSANKTKVFPFFGIDLRHFDECKTKEAVKKKISLLSGQLYDFDKKKTTAVKTGTVVGFKLYPSIGFSPYPENTTKRNRYLNFYKLCEENNIPLTVHCQSIDSGSFKAPDQEKEILNGYLDPSNWAKVIKHTDKLTINFGHFGGDRVLRDTFLNQQTYPKRIPSESWTWEIVKMLKRYPNTYADISAFNFNQQSWLDAFGTMILLDENGCYDDLIQQTPNGNYKLSDKILWGSDWPMVIDDWDDKYQNLFAKFKQSLNFKRIFKEKVKFSSDFEHIAENLIVPDSATICDKIVSINPKKFLFHA